MARRKRTHRRGATFAAAAVVALAFTAPSVSAHYDTSNRDRVPSSYSTVWDCTWQYDGGAWTDNVTVHIATGSAPVPDNDMDGSYARLTTRLDTGWSRLQFQVSHPKRSVPVELGATGY